MKCAKNTPVPSGAIIEYAVWRSSPDVATAGAGRSQPRELTSRVSTATGVSQFLPASVVCDVYRTALESGRTDHHAAYNRVFPDAVRTEAGQRPVRLLGAGVHNFEEKEGTEGTEDTEDGTLPFDS